MIVATNSQLDFLGQLSTLLKRGDKTYRQYMTHGKIFLYAKVLKDNNERIRELIIENAHELPEQHQSNALDLVAHIDIWHILWLDHAGNGEYTLQDEFVFENTDNFPKKAVSSLMDYYAQIRRLMS